MNVVLTGPCHPCVIKLYDTLNQGNLECLLFTNIQWMSEYRTGLVFRQLVLVSFPDSLDFRRCLKSELENPEPNEVYSCKSIRTDRVVGLNDQNIVWNPNSLPFGFRHSLDFVCSIFRHSLHQQPILRGTINGSKILAKKTVENTILKL